LILKHYEIEKKLILNERTYLGNKGKCRYCGKDSSEVKFKKIAHAIPELLGNKFLFSNDECDECNSYFDRHLENDLANFFGISRTTSQILGKKGVPKTKSSGGDRVEVINGDIMIIQSAESDSYKHLDEQTVRISSSPTPYVPINVYKCFVKIALSALPEYALRGFSECIHWVRHNHEPAKFDARLLKMYVTMVPGKNPFRHIWLIIFKRTGDKKEYPYMTCMIAFSNYMFQFVIPFNKKDKYLNLEKIQLPIFPMINGMRLPGQAPNVNPNTQSIDLSGKNSVSQPNNVDMHIEQPMSKIDQHELPEEIRNRIMELGLEFKK